MATVRHLLLGLASSSALYSGIVSALGLGEVTLHSALSQPLEAEIKLLNVGDLTGSDLRVRLAPADVYSRAGVERLMFLNDLRFTPVFNGQNSVIRVVSSQPVSEPYLNFIVEVERPTGQLYREYTVLLDPPGSSAYQSVSAVQTVSVAQSQSQSQSQSQPAPAPRVARTPAVMPKAEMGKGYGVVSGDSLWKIAKRFAPADSAIPSLMADIHALNPQAFVAGDVNRLKAGVQLRLPDRAELPPTVVAAADVAAAGAAAADAALVNEAPVIPAQAPALSPNQLAESIQSEALALTGAPLESVAPVEQALTEQTALLANQAEQTQKLEQNLNTLATQVQQLQEQMTARDQQIALLQAELAEREAQPVAAPVASVPAAQALDADQGSNWFTGLAGLLALVMAGVLALLWRKNRAPKPDNTLAQVLPVAANKSVAVAPTFVRAAQAAPAEKAVERSAVPEGDVLQSANVYMAYGHYKEAAAALSQAWAANPQRGDIGCRYLEVLAQQGDAQAYLELEPQVRATGFNPVRLDELKSTHAQLFVQPPVNLLADVALDERVSESDRVPEQVAPLNLDDFTLNADWDAVNPFAPVSPSNSQPPRQQETAEIFDLADSRDARSPFAQTMLVEEDGHGHWTEELSAELLDMDLNLQDDEFETSVKDNLAKLNIAQAFIDQGNLTGACQVLNEVILEGDEIQQREARDLLARIA